MYCFASPKIPRTFSSFRVNLHSAMKFTTLITPAVLAYSASAATLKFSKTVKATPHPEISSQANKMDITSQHSSSSVKAEDWPLLNPTFAEVVLECENNLSKVDEETRAKFEINGQYSARDTCAKIYAKIDSDRASNSNEGGVEKRSLAELLDWVPELNTTYTEPWKSQGLNETDSETEGQNIPGAVFKQTFHTKELYSMASLAQSYWLNSCYDLMPYESTYNTDPDAFNYVSAEFQTCKEDVDAKYEELKGDITVFLEGRKLFDVKHGKEFWGAVSRLRTGNYSCGGNGDCFAGALRRFVDVVNGMSVEKA
ncbi:hypothetical protein BDZ45DRAFT_811049 [Acephala macrosclerotiorum]|nr:hypothetical protein BDZ45DRAFT_811049 [Acephala macrosclerotiorum]